MNNEQLVEEIIKYVQDENHQYAIAIEGDWGTGKTRFIEKDLFPKLKEKGSKPIRISLFGITDANELYELLGTKLLHMDTSGSKGKTVLKEGAEKLLHAANAISSAAGIPLNLTTSMETIVELFTSSKHVFVFDDTERRSEHADENSLFGAINDLLESKGAKIVFITNKIESQNESKQAFSKDIHEKLIWKVYRYSPKPQDLIREIYTELPSVCEEIDALDCIEKVAGIVNCNNARALLRAEEFIFKLFSLNSVSDKSIPLKSRENALIDVTKFCLLKCMRCEPREPNTDEQDGGLSLGFIEALTQKELYEKYSDFDCIESLFDLRASSALFDLESCFTSYIEKHYPGSPATIALQNNFEALKCIEDYDDEDFEPVVEEFVSIIDEAEFSPTQIENALYWNLQLNNLGFEALSNNTIVDKCKKVIDLYPSQSISYFKYHSFFICTEESFRNQFNQLKDYSHQAYSNHLKDEQELIIKSGMKEPGSAFAKSMTEALHSSVDKLFDHDPALIAKAFFSSSPTGQLDIQRFFIDLKSYLPVNVHDDIQYRWLSSVKKSFEEKDDISRLTAMRRQWVIAIIEELQARGTEQ